MKVIIIGPYPPPYGGISVHVKRMKEYLKTKNINVVVYNESKTVNDLPKSIIPVNSYKKFIFKIPFLKADVLQFHSINKKIRILLGFYKLFNKNIILSLHGESMHNQILESNFIVKKLLYRSLSMIDYITCSNSKIKKDLVDFGIKQSKIEVIPEYIKPCEKREDIDSIPEDVWRFVDKSEFLISANGWIKFYNKQDLYGVDLLIDLIYKLRSRNVDVKLIFALLGVDMQNDKEKVYYYKLRDKVNKLGLKESIYFFESKNIEFYPILAKSQLFIRPTNTDGNSVSLMEALDLDVPCIASDICPRPNGVVLFKTRDIDELVENTLKVIKKYDEYKKDTNSIVLENNAERLLDLYKKCYKLGNMNKLKEDRYNG